MFYKLTKDENGAVRDAQGVRYRLAEVNVAYTPQGKNVGYLEFDTRADALAHFQVTDIPEEELFPSPEEISEV